MEKNIALRAKCTGTKTPLRFPTGILGFEELSQYTLEHKGEGPVWELCQAQDGPRFILFEADAVADRYCPALPRDALKSLGAEGPGELFFFAVAVVPDDIALTTVNLRSPIAVNFEAGLAAQVVLESAGYPMRHPVFPGEGGGPRCS
ncbi:MAG TPA: flagellar assembly protein FliW [Terriglobales bacterium]|nr:flagellar assembly protein FliW [Terriglobales bacterium]